MSSSSTCPTCCQPIRTVGHRAAAAGSKQSERLRMMRQYAVYKQRLSKYLRRPPNAIIDLRIARIRAQQQMLRCKILETGPLPCSWRLSNED